jgi:phage terminase small subunit
MKLTDKQQAFINYYIQCWNATEAARLAGYKGNNATLAAVGYENLRKPHIWAEIERRMRENAMQADEVLSRLSDQARADMGDFIYVKHNYAQLDLEKAKELGLLRHVKKFKTTKQGVEVELYSAQAALQTLAKAHNLLQDKIEVNINIDLVVTAWRELEEAGLSPADAFEELINIARSERQNQSVETGGT